MNRSSPFEIRQDGTFDGIHYEANGAHRAKEEHLKSDNGGNGFVLPGHLGPKTLSSNSDQRTKKTVTWDVFQRMSRHRSADTREETSPFQIDPAVNRPQVLAPSCIESVRMRGLKEKTGCAFAWTRPTYPPTGQSSSVVSSASSTITDLLSKSSLAQSAIARDAFTSKRSKSVDDDDGQLAMLSTKWSAALENVGATGQSNRNTVDQMCKSGYIMSNQSAANLSSGAGAGISGGTPMGELLKSGREGKDGLDETRRRSVGPHEFLELYRSRAYSDPRRLSEAKRAAARSKHRRRNSESQTSVSILRDELEDGGATVIGESRQNPRGLSNRRFSQNILMDLPDTIPENTEMHFGGSSISLPQSPLSVAEIAEIRYPAASSSFPFSCPSSSSSAAAAAASWNNAADRRSRRVDMMDRRLSEPPMTSLQKLSTLRISYHTRTTMAQQRDEADSQSDIHSSSSSSSLNSISTSSKRLTEFPISPESLGIDPPFFSKQHLVVWRDKQSTQILKLPVAVEYHDALQEIIDEDDSVIYSELMRLHRCWELMPNSSTVVALDIELKVVCAFHALTVHGIFAAVLWDSGQQKFVGMLTVTDFIRILQKYRNSREDLERIKDDKILHWKGCVNAEQVIGGDADCHGRGLTSVDPDDNLYDVVCRLRSSGFHRLPVIDAASNNVLFALGYKRILQFICLLMNHLPRPSFMSRTIWELQVGTFHDVASIGQERPLHEALDLLVERRVSALPVVDSEDRVVDIYCKADAMALAANGSYHNLDVTIGETLSTERESFEGVFLCRRTDSLSQIVEWFVRANVHRFVVVDEERRLQGIVSLSDVLRSLVLQPPKRDGQTEDQSDSL